MTRAFVAVTDSQLVLIPTLQTLRLTLRPLELADAEQVQALFPKWEIVRYLTAQVPWPYPADVAFQFYRTSLFLRWSEEMPGSGY